MSRAAAAGKDGREDENDCLSTPEVVRVLDIGTVLVGGFNGELEVTRAKVRSKLGSTELPVAESWAEGNGTLECEVECLEGDYPGCRNQIGVQSYGMKMDQLWHSLLAYDAGNVEHACEI